MRFLTVRLLVSSFLLVLAPTVLAHDVTLTGTQTFASLDGSSADHDGTANGVFTVSDGNLVVNGTVNCNDDGSGSNSACPMAFNVSGNLTVNAGGALYAENRNASGSGGAITLTAGGSLALNGNAIISSAAKTSASGDGGAITANVTGGVALASGSTIDSGSAKAKGGTIDVNAGGVVSVAGSVLSGPSRTILATKLTGQILDGGNPNQQGGQITIRSTTFVEPGVSIASTANVVSQGEKDGAGPVTIDGCGVDVNGLVAAISIKDSPAVVVVRSGKSIAVDGRDLGATGTRMGRVRADALQDGANNDRADFFARGSVSVLGPTGAGTHFAVSSVPGAKSNKDSGGTIRVVALEGGASASGRSFIAGADGKGTRGGTISIAAADDVNLDNAILSSTGDITKPKKDSAGGHIIARSHSGDVSWRTGVGDVGPVGSTSGVPPADQGTIVLTACGTVDTTGSSYPTNGVATSMFPETHTGVCSPAGPSLPSGVPVLVTCNTPPVANDTAATTNEDTTVTITLTGSDADGDTLTFTIVSGPSNGSLGPVVFVNATTSTVNYTPALNYNGTDSFVFRANDGNGGTDDATASIVIVPVNDPPTFLAGPTVTVLEDASGTQTYANWATAISPGPADESAQAVTFTVTNNNNALFSVQPTLSPTGTLSFTLAANAYGSATITITAQDSGGTLNGGNDTSAPQTSSITVTPVNDEPSFVAGANQTVNEDAGPQSVSGWATAISAGPNEGGQTLTFVTSSNNPSLFSAQPAVSASGTLTYTPAADANGNATVSIYLMDNGGIANGGDDTSPTQTFTITVNAVNDEPSFTGGGNVTVLEDSGAYSATWATSISAGPADESGQILTFTTSNDNNALFSSQPSVSSSGLLTFTPAANAYGSATVSVTLSDNGGIANGGDDTSPTQTFTLTITPVNDEPSFTSGGNVTVNEDSGAYSAPWATGISAGLNESSQNVTFTTSNDNNALFSAQPSVSPGGVLTFTPAANAFGSATVTIYLMDDGGTANPGDDDTSPSQTFTITVNSVNDAPSFTSGGNVTVSEDSGAYSAAWATAISAGPANESSQAVTFNVNNSNNALFSVQPSVSSTGVLSFTPNANTTGSATVTIFAQDDGGIANGGVNVSASQTFTITFSDVNDPPTFTPGGDQTSNEDAGPQSVVWATSISAGPPNESGQTVTFFVSNDNNALFSAQPSIASTGTLTYTANANANGSAIVTVYAQDNGGTANGGDDTSATYTFTITVVAVNDAPSFTGGGNATVNEDSGAYSAAWATAISAGPADEAGQTLTFNVVSNSNPSLFTSGPSISSTGVLSFTPAANAFGSATITINLQDDGGGADTSANYTFTITVNAVNDVPSFTPGGDVTVNEDSGPYSQPWATSISAGPANESGQTLTFLVSNNNNALFLVQPSISSSGQLTFTPSLNASGSAIVTVSLQDNGGTANGGVDTSGSVQFTITVTPANDGPTAGNDSWETLGNTELRVDLAGGLTPKIVDTTPSGNGVRDNDSDPDGDPFFVTGIVGCSDVTSPFDCTLGDGSKVSMLANGSFSYTPGPGNTTGSFQYTVTDVPAFGAPASSIGTVTITIHDMIWYVNGSAAAGGNGTSISPFMNFATLNGAGDVDDPGDTIFVSTSAVTGSIDLEANEKFWGEGYGLATSFNLNGNGSPQVLVAPGVKPTILSGSDTVTVTGVAGVDIAGVALTSASGNGIDVTSALAGPAAGATIHDNTILGAAQEGIDVNAGSAAGTAVTVSNTSITSAGNGFDVISTGPAVASYVGGTIASTGGTGIRMDGSVSGNLTVSGLTNVTIDGNTAASGISITAATFDAIAGGSFNTVNGGAIVVGSSGNPVGGAGVVLSNVSGDYAIGTLTAFGGTSGVTVGGSGLFTGAAGMRVTNGGGSISAPSGVGLSVTNATIGAANLNFTSISAANAANGIDLNNTGTLGGLTVTGTGSAGSGGTIQNITNRGASFVSASRIALSWMNFTNANTTDGANSDGIVGGNENTDENGALHFQSVTGVDLDRLQISGASQHGINGNNVTDLDISNTTITNTGNEVWESGIYLFHLKGVPSAGLTNVFNSVQISSSGQFNMFVQNASGTNAAPGEKDRLELTNCTFSSSGVNVIGDHVSIFNSGTANFQSVVSGCSFSATIGRTSDSIQVDAGSNASSDVSISGSTFLNPSQTAINLSGSGNGKQTFSVANNPSISVRGGDSVNVASNGASSLRGTIANNSMTTNVVNNPGFGIDMVVDGTGTIAADVNANTINGHSIGIRGGARNAGTGTASLTIRNNVVTSGGTAEFVGMWLFSGNGSAGETNSVCVNLVANQVDITTGAGFVDYYLEQYTGNVFQLQGLSGSGTNAANVEAFVASTDTDPSPTDPTVDVSSGTIVNYSSGICATP